MDVLKLNAEELRLNLTAERSWHAAYRACSWVYVGGLAAALTEGDVICVMSQWGEVEDIHLVRDEETGRHRGFAFLKYEDARSAVLAVDNFAGVSLLDKTLRVDHKADYVRPKTAEERAAEKAAAAAGIALPARALVTGSAYADATRVVDNGFSIERGVNHFARQGRGEEEERGGMGAGAGGGGGPSRVWVATAAPPSLHAPSLVAATTGAAVPVPVVPAAAAAPGAAAAAGRDGDRHWLESERGYDDGDRRRERSRSRGRDGGSGGGGGRHHRRSRSRSRSRDYERHRDRGRDRDDRGRDSDYRGGGRNFRAHDDPSRRGQDDRRHWHEDNVRRGRDYKHDHGRR